MIGYDQVTNHRFWASAALASVLQGLHPFEFLQSITSPSAITQKHVTRTTVRRLLNPNLPAHNLRILACAGGRIQARCRGRCRSRCGAGAGTPARGI